MELITRISELDEIKKEKKAIGAKEKELSDAFKEFLRAEGIDTLIDESTGLSVVMTVSEGTSVDEEILKNEVKKFIKNNKDHEFIKDIKKCIKRVEVVNEEQIEHLIRMGILDVSILAPATTIKTTERLNVKKVKKGGK